LSVLQGVFGILFGIEGFTGYTTYNLQIIRRFTVLLFIYLIATGIIGSVIIYLTNIRGNKFIRGLILLPGTFNLITINQFCSTADDTDRCREQAEFNAYGLLLGGSISLFTFLLATRRWLRRASNISRSIKDPPEEKSAISTTSGPFRRSARGNRAISLFGRRGYHLWLKDAKTRARGIFGSQMKSPKRAQLAAHHQSTLVEIPSSVSEEGQAYD